ncbi:MAG: Crp/Fnr family transcriptional regulator [Bdellovibrionales bacterium]|nr:Crp/Fnr family transcriptional regulator [Bdellovibrionales bacterium]
MSQSGENPTNKPPQVPTLRLKKGQILFREGENAGAMYLVRHGSIRVFKKKGDSDIEIENIRSGQIIGELSFLDGNPRSASAEILSECELVEISGPSFQQALDKVPEWLKILFRTLVTRLRSASTKIRQLESASTEFVYNEKDGKRVAQSVYLSAPDVMKIGTAILLVATRWGKPTTDGDQAGIELPASLLQRYANQISQLPASKMTSVIDAFSVAGFMKSDESSGRVTLLDIEFLEKLIHYMNEENLQDPSKRHDISNRGFLIMSLMARHLSRYPKNSEGVSLVNVAEILRLETPEAGRAPFRLDDFAELVTLGYASNVTATSADEVMTSVNVDSFQHATRLQRALKSIEAINDQKRKTGN